MGWATKLAADRVNTLGEWLLICPPRDTGRKDSEGEPIRELDLVFPNDRGKVESLANMINRGLIPAQIRSGVTVDTGELDGDGQPILTARYTGMHALLHFYASRCINRPQDGPDLPPKVVQERLGHATINLTMDTCSHLFPRGDDDDELVAAESALLGKSASFLPQARSAVARACAGLFGHRLFSAHPTRA